MVGGLLGYPKKMAKPGLFWLLVTTAQEDSAPVRESYEVSDMQRSDAQILWSTCVAKLMSSNHCEWRFLLTPGGIS